MSLARLSKQAKARVIRVNSCLNLIRGLRARNTLFCFIILASLFLQCVPSASFIFCAKAAEADSIEKLPVFSDGGAGLEIGISGNNKIILEKEETHISFDGERSRDRLDCRTHSEYELLNSDDWDAYAAIAVVRLLKVKKISVKKENEKSFRSGVSIAADGEEVPGFIYPIGKPAGLLANSAYDSFSETLGHMEYSEYFGEAFASYGITSFTDYEERLTGKINNIPQSTARDYYVVDEGGEEMLCVTVHNLHFSAMEIKHITVENEFTGVMTRPTAYTSDGTEFSFEYCGNNLSSFYSVRNIKLSFSLPEQESLGFIESDAPIFPENGVKTIKYAAPYGRFNFVLGKRLNNDEIFEIKYKNGIWEKVFYWAGVFTVVIILLSLPYIIYSAIKRRKSGIGMKLY